MQTKTKETFKYFFKFSKPYYISFSIIAISMVIVSSLNSITPIFYKNLFNQLAIFDLNRSQAISVLIGILLTIFSIKITQWTLYRILSVLIVYFENNAITDISAYCFKYLHNHSFSYFNNTFAGSLVKKTKSFARAFEVIMDQLFFEIIPIICSITVIFIVLFLNEPILSLIVLIWISLFVFVNSIFIKHKLKHDILKSSAETKVTGVLADTISNHSNIKLFTGLKKEVFDFQSVLDDLKRKRAYVWGMSNIFEAIQAILIIILEIGIFYVAINLWKDGKITPGDFILLQTYLVTIFNFSWNFSRIIRRIYENLAEAEEMTVVLTTPHEITDDKNAKKLRIKNPSISFNNVSFSYKNNKRIINNLSFDIKSKEKIAIIGPSGSGKTTLIKLLLRIHDLDGGQIFIDNQDISKVTQNSLRENVSMVPQDPILFHRSIMENIRYGKNNASDNDVILASKLAHCHEFISKLPEKYNTFVGERGVKLSGGERQRVAIARAILRNSPILILDEATSSLDSESEKLIQDALNNLVKNKTVIIIAHRLSTIKLVDRILVVKRGKIVEEGTHKELFYKDKGLYQKLWNIQSSGFKESN